MRIKKICKQCGKEFEIEASRLKEKNRGKFCTVKHRGKFYSGKNNPNFSTEIVRCSNCGKQLKRTLYRRNKNKHFFCNLQCYGIYFHGKPAFGVGGRKGERPSIKTEFKKGMHVNPETQFKKGDPFFKNRYKDDYYLFKLFKGHLFPDLSMSQLTDIDKKVIEAKILIHKIRGFLNVNQ